MYSSAVYMQTLALNRAHSSIRPCVLRFWNRASAMTALDDSRFPAQFPCGETDRTMPPASFLYDNVPQFLKFADGAITGLVSVVPPLMPTTNTKLLVSSD